MIQAAPWLFGFILAIGTPVKGRAQCSISVAEPQLCAQTSLSVTIRCRNESPSPLEWLETDNRRASWELTRPDGSSETAYRSRYSVGPRLLELPSGEELSVTAPLTRWFALADPGSYRLRFRLHDRSDSMLLETNEVSFSVKPCDAEAILTACQTFLNKSPADLEAVSGFETEAALPCMKEALARGSAQSVSIIEGLARINTPATIDVLVKHFYDSDAFDRLAVWQALHRVNTSGLSAELQERVSKVLKEKPVSIQG